MVAARSRGPSASVDASARPSGGPSITSARPATAPSVVGSPAAASRAKAAAWAGVPTPAATARAASVPAWLRRGARPDSSAAPSSARAVAGASPASSRAASGAGMGAGAGRGTTVSRVASVTTRRRESPAVSDSSVRATTRPPASDRSAVPRRAARTRAARTCPGDTNSVGAAIARAPEGLVARAGETRAWVGLEPRVALTGATSARRGPVSSAGAPKAR